MHLDSYMVGQLGHLDVWALKTLGYLGTRGTLFDRLGLLKTQKFLGIYLFLLGAATL